LVIHEFAHQLDEMDGFINGTPYLPDRQFADQWHAAMNAEFFRLRQSIRSGQSTFLGEYGAKDDGEFFAVASERFFTRPAETRDLHPQLYALLARFYRVDPIAWFRRANSNRATLDS
jgi:Mlc titration factor MtfA (ptsG expression regulator)